MYSQFSVFNDAVITLEAPTGLTMVNTLNRLDSPSILPNRIRLYRYLILFGGSQPISACFFPFLRSQTRA